MDGTEQYKENIKIVYGGERMADGYQAPSVKRAFQILRLIAESGRGLGVSEMAKKMGWSKGSVHGIAAALEEVGAIKRDPHTKKYELGYTILELSRRTLSAMPLREKARRHMEALMEEIGETVFLCIVNNRHALVLDVVESNKEMKVAPSSGTRLSLTVGASGKVLLSLMDEEKVREYLSGKGLTRYTKQSLTDLDVYLEELGTVRKRGYALDYEEYLEGVRAVAAPIGTDGSLLACICVLGFTSSLTDDRMEHIITGTLQTAGAISRELGGASEY